MTTIIIVLFTGSMIVWSFFLLDASFGLRKIDKLENEEKLIHGPLLSIIVAARNEEKHLENSIRSQLNQTYKRIEWILVNDRSTDATGEIMKRLKTEDSRIKVLQIDSLPSGWLGKNYAMYRGSLKAKGELLLFTDADVIYKKEAVAKGIAYVKKHQLDHLTVAPNLRAKSFWLRTFIAFFLFSFSYLKRPWLTNDDHSKKGMGIGAFNLVSKKAYEKFGTHKSIKMRPDDDLQLGIRMKQLGFHQRMVTGLKLLEVEWYGSLREALVGLEKNTFAGLHYRISMVLFAIFGIFSTNIIPFITLFSTNHIIAMLSLINMMIIIVLYTIVIRKMTSFSPWMFIVFPITASIFIYSIIRATCLTLKRGGIIWRGTTYSLKELRQNKGGK